MVTSCIGFYAACSSIVSIINFQYPSLFQEIEELLNNQVLNTKSYIDSISIFLGFGVIVFIILYSSCDCFQIKHIILSWLGTQIL